MDIEKQDPTREPPASGNPAFEKHFYTTLHDLRAPLRAISNLAQWIEEDLGTAERAEWPEHMKMLRQRAQDMATLLDGLVGHFRDGSD